MKDSYRAAVHDFSVMDAVLVILETADGTRGIGTADPSPGYSRQTSQEIWDALSDVILPRFLEVQPETPCEGAAVLESVQGHENARCAVEMAFLDLCGHVNDKSVASFFGGTSRKRERLNAWIGVDTPQSMAENARVWRDRGFASLKLKLDGNPERDIERVRTVVGAVGSQMQVRADVNGAYDSKTAIDVARELEDTELVHLEQPVPQDDLDGLEAVTKSTSTTIMADECLLTLDHVRKVLDRGAADRLKLKPLRLGGLLQANDALEMAADAGIDCVVGHGFGLTPATSAELLLTTSHENVFRPVESVGLLKMADQPFESTYSYSDGMVQLAEAPGLGVSVSDNHLSEFSETRLTIP
ncbi:mandelate racemase/muconate lactonizing enzyme family protein [Halorussus salinisoli]|uniref:mandelate racemase/muconate lactonizing enzyme family protein n=1 Tax=Halorussus salinisoli TaxID=2558242 RepID=UPI0014852E5A|nr:enolase C-terminal domain-like protein [Halorussus salinisoli]